MQSMHQYMVQHQVSLVHHYCDTFYALQQNNIDWGDLNKHRDGDINQTLFGLATGNNLTKSPQSVQWIHSTKSRRLPLFGNLDIWVACWMHCDPSWDGYWSLGTVDWHRIYRSLGFRRIGTIWKIHIKWLSHQFVLRESYLCPLRKKKNNFWQV